MSVIPQSIQSEPTPEKGSTQSLQTEVPIGARRHSSMPHAAPPPLEAAGLCKRFGSHQVLKDVSISLKPGRFRALLGENGAGKSTLVKCIMGTYIPESGTVKVGTNAVELKNPRQAHALGLGMV